jgi:hypothetical protein
MRAFLAAAAVAALAVPAAPAAAAGTTPPAANGGVEYGAPLPAATTPAKPPEKKTPPVKAPPAKTPPAKKPPKADLRPVLAAFSVAPALLNPGATPSVTFRVTGPAPIIRLRLVVEWPGTTNPSRRIELGRLPTGADQTLPLPALADPALPEGTVTVRIAGRDSAGRLLRPAAHLSRVQTIEVRAHVFPLTGTFTYGGPGARFGAPRTGHTHQGQDLMAAEGTPVVAVRGGTISYSQYQAGGAGYYLVLDAEGEDFDYAYMHLREGSILVKQGDHVVAGQRLADVGHTGDAQGDHLHFEIWQGAWYDGGSVVDPLSLLQQWQAWSSVRAT